MQQLETTTPLGDAALVRDMDGRHLQTCRAQRLLLSSIAEADRRELWRAYGARDMAHWLWMRYGLSNWKAKRWLQAAYALESLPKIEAAFTSGSLGVDKVVELCRFAAAESEGELLPWADRVAAGAIRARGDELATRTLEEVSDTEHARSLHWWHEEEAGVLHLEATLPAASGSVVTKAIDRLAKTLSGLDPVRWTPEHWTLAVQGRESPCREPTRSTRPSSGLRPSGCTALRVAG